MSLAIDTDVEPLEEGRYRGAVSDDWVVWGPNGGYLAAIALRAAGRRASLPRPASLYCRYLGVPRSGPVDVSVSALRTSRRTESLRVAMTQDNRAVVEAVVTAVAALPGPERRWSRPPDIPPRDELLTLEEQALAVGRPPVPFWKNIEVRAIERHEPTPDGPPSEPRLLAWGRFRPQATFDDVWADACRALILVDTSQFPAVTRAFAASELTFMAPSLDVYVAFHGAAPEQEWLVCEARGVAALDGLIAGQAWVWSADGRLVASGAQQMLVVSHRRPW
jgi:acyl-CoA thioesterase